MQPTLPRRLLFAGALGALATHPARAEAKTLTVFGHKVHQAAATTGPGGDATQPWRERAGAAIEWVTLGDNNAIHERLLREVTLSQTAIDVAYLVNGRAVPRNLRLFEPLDPFMASAPIERFDDFAKGLVTRLQVDGTQRGIPVRHATNTLICNEAILAERGVAVPTSFEELVEAIRKLTFRRADGTQVYGLAFTPVFASNFLSIARCLNGDFMTPDARIVCAEPAMVQALATFAELFKAGALPRNITTLSNEEVTTWMQQGRAAITINPFARLPTYNDPAQSKFPGQLKPFDPPMAAALKGKVPYASTVEFWSLVIPKNARDKALSWSFVQALSAPAATLAMALNGNGPPRLSTYHEPRLLAASPYAPAEERAVAASRIHLPAFDEQARAHDIFVEESQAAMLGLKPADKAMADAAARVAPLLKG